MSATRSPLSYPAFRVLWLAGIVTFIGSFVQNVGEAWLMMDLTKSPLPVAMLSTAFVGASLFMMLPAGVLADRRDRRSVAIVSQIVQATAALAMAALSFTGHITPAALVGGVALLGIGMALGAPAWAALVPELVPRDMVAEAVALNAVAFNLARAVGPAIGGIVLARFGATTSFVLNAASFGVVMVALMMYRNAEPPPPAPSVRPLASAFAEPWRVMVAAGDLRSISVAMIGFTLGAGIFYALTPAFGKDTLGATPLEYGVMIGAMGGGAVIGASVMKRLRKRVHPQTLVAGAMLLFATCIAIVSRVSSLTLAMALLVPAGAGWLGSFSSLQALVQIWAPDRLRARVVALYQMAHLATWALASALGGYIADRHGIRAAMGAGTVVCACAALSTWRLGLPSSFTGEPP
ncbi:MAG: putative transrane transport protein [Labilithrix sp.]|nr:putative transrane transport protein [Labilithrix sp.]